MFRLRPHHNWGYPEPLLAWGATMGVVPGVNNLTDQRGIEHEATAIYGQRK